MTTDESAKRPSLDYPKYLDELADIADPDQLWRLPLLDQVDLEPARRQQLDTGVALRRYAAHRREMESLIGTGNSLLLTPLGKNGSSHAHVPTDLRSALEASNKALRKLAIGPAGGFFGYRGCSVCNVSWAKDKEETHAVGCPARAIAPALVDGKEKS